MWKKEAQAPSPFCLPPPAGSATPSKFQASCYGNYQHGYKTREELYISSIYTLFNFIKERVMVVDPVTKTVRPQDSSAPRKEGLSAEGTLDDNQLFGHGHPEEKTISRLCPFSAESSQCKMPINNFHVFVLLNLCNLTMEESHHSFPPVLHLSIRNLFPSVSKDVWGQFQHWLLCKKALGIDVSASNLAI